MHLVVSLVLVVCFQVTSLHANCNEIQEATATTTTTTRGQQQDSNSSSNNNGTSNGNNEKQANFTTCGETALNRTLNNSSLTNRHTGKQKASQPNHNMYDRFRLEYNKYKILSHLGMTQNLDDITPRIDEDLRFKLLTSAAIKDSLNPPDSATSSRRKRSLTCDQVKNEKNACCLDNFYVNFTHIGWDKWILYPPGYQANYCRGKCDLSHARYYHSTLLSKYSHVISLCCSPRQMGPLSLLYIDEENKVHQKSIPDMVVESCDCA